MKQIQNWYLSSKQRCCRFSSCFQHLNSHLYELIFTKHLLKVVQKQEVNDLEMLITSKFINQVDMQNSHTDFRNCFIGSCKILQNYFSLVSFNLNANFLFSISGLARTWWKSYIISNEAATTSWDKKCKTEEKYCFH